MQINLIVLDNQSKSLSRIINTSIFITQSLCMTNMECQFNFKTINKLLFILISYPSNLISYRFSQSKHIETHLVSWIRNCLDDSSIILQDSLIIELSNVIIFPWASFNSSSVNLLLCVLDQSLQRSNICSELTHIVGHTEIIIVCVERWITILWMFRTHKSISCWAWD